MLIKFFCTFKITSDYTLDFYKLSTAVTVRNATKAGCNVVKQVENPVLSGLMYPLLQCLDEKYLKADAQFGGIDQRKIFALSEEFMERKIVHLMNPMVPGLNNAKMSSSDDSSKIDLLDEPSAIRKKLNKSYFSVEDCETSALLLFIRHVCFHISSDNSFTVDRSEENGGNVKFCNYEDLLKACKDETIHPADLKNSLINFLTVILGPVREAFNTPDMKKLITEAYPNDDKKNGQSIFEFIFLKLVIKLQRNPTKF